MSDLRLAPEISDYIIDFLHYQPKTLKRCCLVSKNRGSRAPESTFSVRSSSGISLISRRGRTLFRILQIRLRITPVVCLSNIA